MYERVHDRLGVDDDVDPLVREAEQVVRLDQLEALVQERRRVDRDPPAHLPGRMRERLLGRHAGQVRPAAERASRRREHEPVHASRAVRTHELKQGGVLGVDRDDPGVGGLCERDHEVATDHEALLVGQGQLDALCERDDRRPEPGRADHPVQDEVGAGGRRPTP